MAINIIVLASLLAQAQVEHRAANNSLIGVILFLVVLGGAAYLFVSRCAKLINVLKQGKPEVRTDQTQERIKRFLTGVLFQERLWRDFWPGFAHVIVFWGFLVIQLGLFEFILTGLTGWSIPLLTSAVFGWTLDIVVVLVILSLAYFAYRRLVIKPRQLTTTRDAWIILGGIAAVCVTLLLAESFRWATLRNEEATQALFGWQFGQAVFSGLDSNTAQILWTASWWAHVLVVMAFLIYLPSSKHLHLLSTPFNAYFQNLRPKGELRKIENIEDIEHYGANKVEDFSWRDLLDTYACTECGRCTAVCPANITGKPLNPKKIIIDLKTTLFAQNGMGIVGHAAGVGGTKTDDGSEGGQLETAIPVAIGASSISNAMVNDGAADSGGGGVALAAQLPPLVGGMITHDELWACTTCRACMTECPVFIEHVPKIVDMRRYLVMEESEFPAEVIPLFNNLERNGNPWTMRPQERMEWTTKLPFDIRVLAEVDEGQEVDVLFWVGCMGALDQRNKKVTQNLAMILEEAGLNWAILGPEETCTGDPAQRIGNEYLFQTLAQQNVETLNGYKETHKIRRIVTACPHCFNSIKANYAGFGLSNFEVIHHTELVAKLIEEGKIKTGDGLANTKITYHDPCYLGRYNDIYDAPRYVLNSLGSGLKKIDFVEMPRNRSKSFCCGAGGGQAFMEEKIGARVNSTRMKEAVETGASIVAVACGFCNSMLTAAVASDNLDEKIQILDVTELVQLSRKPKAELGVVAAADGGTPQP